MSSQPSLPPIADVPADGKDAIAAATLSTPVSGASVTHDVDVERRFGGIARLYGAAGLAAFRRAHVCVIGVGGVGSWAVEALARTAISKITLVDLDHLAESNVNRQIHALTDTLGQSKVGALSARIAQINPYCDVTEVEEFLDPDNVAQLLPPGRYDYVIDAIDNARAKVALIVHCRQHQIPLLTIGSAGGQVDPTRIEVCDLSRTEQEPLLARVRKRLRAEHGFPRDRRHKFHIDAVWSSEPLRQPALSELGLDELGEDELGMGAVVGHEEAAAAGAGTTSAAGRADSISSTATSSTATNSTSTSTNSPGLTGINCAGYGSSVVVTASFGFVAAGHVLRKLAERASSDPGASPAQSAASPVPTVLAAPAEPDR